MGNQIHKGRVSLLSVINNSSSIVVLECTRSHFAVTTYMNLFSLVEIRYKKGERLPRYMIYLKPGHWKIAAKKYQPDYKKPSAKSY